VTPNPSIAAARAWPRLMLCPRPMLHRLAPAWPVSNRCQGVMAGLVPAIHAIFLLDARNKRGHDA